METPESPFDAYYYQHCCGSLYERNDAWLNFFGGIAKRIVTEINPATALDAGCAMGFLVECLRQESVLAEGIDISEYAISKAHGSIQPYVRVGSITQPLPQKYDLIVSIEVLEHLHQQECEEAIQNLCQFTDDILFSSTPYDTVEATHYNVQLPDYWIEQFARHGLFRDVDFDATFITPWAIRFRRRQEPVQRIVRNYERKNWALSVENTDLRSQLIALGGQLTQAETQVEFAQASLAETQADRAQLERQLHEHEERWADLQKGWMWRLVQKIWGVRLWLIPRGSKRESWLNRLKSN